MNGKPVLSKRAQKLYARVCEGRWYGAHTKSVPAAMAELESAGLVTTVGRPMIVALAYVPTTGYRAYESERYGDTK